MERNIHFKRDYWLKITVWPLKREIGTHWLSVKEWLVTKDSDVLGNKPKRCCNTKHNTPPCYFFTYEMKHSHFANTKNNLLQAAHAFFMFLSQISASRKPNPSNEPTALLDPLCVFSCFIWSVIFYSCTGSLKHTDEITEWKVKNCGVRRLQPHAAVLQFCQQGATSQNMDGRNRQGKKRRGRKERKIKGRKEEKGKNIWIFV